MNVQRALSGRHSNARTCQAGGSTHGRASATKFVSALARAVRPLAASALPQRLDSEEKDSFFLHNFLTEKKNPMLGKAMVLLCEVTACSKQTQALRRSAKPKTRSRAATSFARGGGLRLFASGTTQRTMHAGRVPQSALPNPSIEGTNNGGSSLRVFAYAQPPLFAPHVKR